MFWTGKWESQKKAGSSGTSASQNKCISTSCLLIAGQHCPLHVFQRVGAMDWLAPSAQVGQEGLITTSADL